jgi:transcriptional regulator with XRE-family HTH domain
MSYEINQRVLLLRKSLKLNQTEFGERIGVSRGVINNIDLSIVDIETKPLLIQQICKEYNVSRVWLETGEGDMFLPQTKDDVITDFMASLLCDEEESFRRRFVEMLAGLDDDGWIFLEKTLDALYPDKSKKEQE